jgi:glycosyltransferase involved in cell wall biosynthesis
LDEHLGVALRALAAIGQRVLVLNLGAGAAALPPVETIPVVSPGWLTSDVLAEHLGAADLFLSPLADGASMRRTTIAAALQHGLPVVSTDGYLSDRRLRAVDSGIEMVRVDDPSAFASAAASLACDPCERERRSRDARRAYTSIWAWPRIVEDLVDLLDAESVSSGAPGPD